MKTRRVIVFLVIAGIIIVVSVALWVRKPPKYAGSVEKMKLGVYLGDPSPLIYIAKTNGFFKDQGLDVSVTEHETGSLAVDDLLAGKVDIATATEFVFVSQILKREDLRILGSISTANNMEIIARKDRGITRPGDLKGKKIGVSRGTINEFFLRTFLDSNNLKYKDIQSVDLKPLELVSAISKGEIDAAILFPEQAFRVKKELGQRAVIWNGQSGQDYYFLLITKGDFIKARPSAAERLLRALLAAEQFVQNQEKEAQDIMRGLLNHDAESMRSAWSKVDLRLRLDQDLLALMEDETKWFMVNKLTDRKDMPNYFDFIYLDGLKRINPPSVSIIH